MKPTIIRNPDRDTVHIWGIFSRMIELKKSTKITGWDEDHLTKTRKAVYDTTPEIETLEAEITHLRSTFLKGATP